MFIARGTVKIHLSHIYAKLGVRNRSELVGLAAQVANSARVVRFPITQLARPSRNSARLAAARFIAWGRSGPADPCQMTSYRACASRNGAEVGRRIAVGGEQFLDKRLALSASPDARNESGEVPRDGADAHVLEVVQTRPRVGVEQIRNRDVPVESLSGQ